MPPRHIAYGGANYVEYNVALRQGCQLKLWGGRARPIPN